MNINEIPREYVRGVENAMMYIRDEGYDGNKRLTIPNILNCIGAWQCSGMDDSPYEFDRSLYNAYGVTKEQVKVIKKNW